MDDYEDSSDGSSLDLITSLANNATSAYETTAALNANPLNTALIYGGTASTVQGAVNSGTSIVPSGSGMWFLLVAVVIIGIVVLREE